MNDSQWLSFDEQKKSKSGLTRVWHIITKDTPHIKLGEIKWFGRWRRYAFFPTADTVFEPVCLRDIADFCDETTLDKRREIMSRKKIS